jgi:peptidoglycan/xylan/chitin deacetylase (PgdA/CDA1 family)
VGDGPERGHDAGIARFGRTGQASRRARLTVRGGARNLSRPGPATVAWLDETEEIVTAALLLAWDLLLVGAPLAVVAFLANAWRKEHAADRVPVLCYHRLTAVADLEAGRFKDDEPVWTVLDRDFEGQLDVLAAQGFETLDLDDVRAIRNGERPAPARGIVLTFDDGYESVLRIAAPALQRRGMKAVVYALLEPDEYTRTHVEGIDRICTHEEIVALQDHGLQIGSHSMTHAILTELPADKLRWEVEASREQLGALIGRPIDHFCIPRGGVSQQVVDAVRAAGYWSCTGLAKGTARMSGDWLAAPRIAVERHHTPERFAKLLQPRHAFVHKVLGDLRLVPTRLLGAKRGKWLRGILYGPVLGWLFKPRNVKRFLALAVVLYGVAFAEMVLRRLG